MSLLESIKPFWPLLFTFILPRALGYFNALKTAYRTRPPPSPLPPRVDRSLNILFCSILFFLIQSFPRGPDRDIQNVFSTTNTRLGVPTDVLFARLAMMRPSGVLSKTDDALRSTLVTKDSRFIYLTHGPYALLNCSFCHPSRPHTYTLYNLPTTVLLPHLLHLLVIGIATSAPLTTHLTARSRTTFLIPVLGLLFVDLYLNTLYTPFPTLINTTQQPPTSLFTLLKTIRPISICLLDAAFAFYIYTTTTNRFLLFPFLSDPNASSTTDVPTLQAQTQDLVRNTSVVLQTSQAKLRALNIARNTVIRDESLKGREDRYWADVRSFEGGTRSDVGEGNDDEIYQDEEVQAAIARVYGRGGVDVPRARREAGAFVEGVTKGLEVGEVELGGG